MAAGKLVIDWSGVSGKSCAIDHKEELTDPTWTKIATGVSAVEPVTSAEVTLDAEDLNGFFRVRIE